MSQSILYNSFGIKGVTYCSTDFIGNGVSFNVETTEHHVQCSTCDNRDYILVRAVTINHPAIPNNL